MDSYEVATDIGKGLILMSASLAILFIGIAVGQAMMGEPISLTHSSCVSAVLDCPPDDLEGCLQDAERLNCSVGVTMHLTPGSEYRLGTVRLTGLTELETNPLTVPIKLSE